MSYWSDTIRRGRHVRRSPLTGLLSGAALASDLLSTWRDRLAQRRQLAGLDPRMLKDIGVSRSDAMEEAGKPFWKD